MRLPQVTNLVLQSLRKLIGPKSEAPPSYGEMLPTTPEIFTEAQVWASQAIKDLTAPQIDNFTIDSVLNPDWVADVVNGGAAGGDANLRLKSALFVAVYSEHFAQLSLAEGITYPANPSLTVNLAIMLEAISGSRGGCLTAPKVDKTQIAENQMSALKTDRVTVPEMVQLFQANPALTFLTLACLTRKTSS